MRLFRKFPVLLLATLFAMVLGASKCSKGGQLDAMKRLAEGQWQLTELAGKAVELPADVERPYLAFDPAESSVSGFGGCNRLMGKVEVVGDQLGFPGLGSTKRLCAEGSKLEDAFTGALRQVSSFKLNGDKLTLLGDGARELLSLTQVK